MLKRNINQGEVYRQKSWFPATLLKAHVSAQMHSMKSSDKPMKRLSCLEVTKKFLLKSIMMRKSLLNFWLWENGLIFYPFWWVLMTKQQTLVIFRFVDVLMNVLAFSRTNFSSASLQSTVENNAKVIIWLEVNEIEILE